MTDFVFYQDIVQFQMKEQSFILPVFQHTMTGRMNVW